VYAPAKSPEPTIRASDLSRWLPSRLVKGLAGGGYITPNEADMPHELSRVRSDVAHGRLDLAPT
jgi:hypothetical protein